MKLFAVDRYSGNRRGCIDKDTEKKRLAQLLSKVEKRRANIKKTKAALKQHIAASKAEKKLLAAISADKEKPLAVVTAAQPAEKEETQKTPEPEQDEETSVAEPSTKRLRPSSEPEQPEGFTVIGKDHFRKVKEVKAVLPRWLAHPTVISVDMRHHQTKVEDIPSLAPFLKEKLIEQGVKNFFAVQSEVIPWLLQEHKNSLSGYWPRDVCVSAPTGSGKTLAFVLPIIQALQPLLVRQIRALVVLPVQDLAKQVFGVFRTYCEATGLKVVLATGHGALHDEQRQLVLQDVCGCRAMADIVVTTPGRLVHHLRDTSGLSLQHLRFLVVDEADRVMDGVQSDWLYHLDRHMSASSDPVTKDATASLQPCQAPLLTVANLLSCRAPPQKLLFSATLSHDPEKLAQLGLFQPKLFTCVVKRKDKSREQTTTDENGDVRGDFVGKFAMPAEIREYYVMCDEEGAKPLLLYCLLVARAVKRQEKTCRTLCFADSRLAAHRLALLLQALSAAEVDGPNLRVAEISAGLRRPERVAILTKFTQGNLDVIISSDALARGIDIPHVDCVVSYDAPKVAKQYIHRVGRTGRAGRRGKAITLLQPQQLGQFQHMLRSAGKHAALDDMPTPITEMETLEEKYLQALASVKQTIQEEEAVALESSKTKKNKSKNSKKKRSKKKQKLAAKKNPNRTPNSSKELKTKNKN